MSKPIIMKKRIVRTVNCPVCKKTCYALLNSKYPFLEWEKSQYYEHRSKRHAVRWAEDIKKHFRPPDEEQDIVFEAIMKEGGGVDFRDAISSQDETKTPNNTNKLHLMKE